jgi:uncharacterized membrane protein
MNAVIAAITVTAWRGVIGASLGVAWKEIGQRHAQGDVSGEEYDRAVNDIFYLKLSPDAAAR